MLIYLKSYDLISSCFSGIRGINSHVNACQTEGNSDVGGKSAMGQVAEPCGEPVPMTAESVARLMIQGYFSDEHCAGVDRRILEAYAELLPVEEKS